MPKKTHIYRDFSGGENTSASPRVIKQNELQLVSGAMVDELGYLSSFYPPQKASATANLKDFTYFVAPGRGLFYFKSDYSYASGAATADDGPYHYIMITDRSTGNISIENVIAILVIVASMTLAFGFMKSDISSIKKELELKVDEREFTSDRNLLIYKMDVIMQDIAEIKQILKENK